LIFKNIYYIIYIENENRKEKVMARGANAKVMFFNKLQEVFPDAFMQDAKTMRIPFEEDGSIVELKVAPTAAKDVLGSGSAVVASAPAKAGFDWSEGGDSEPTANPVQEPTAEEKANLEKLLTALDL
jgi:hypothetical protein